MYISPVNFYALQDSFLIILFASVTVHRHINNVQIWYVLQNTVYISNFFPMTKIKEGRGNCLWRYLQKSYHHTGWHDSSRKINCISTLTCKSNPKNVQTFEKLDITFNQSCRKTICSQHSLMQSSASFPSLLPKTQGHPDVSTVFL